MIRQHCKLWVKCRQCELKIYIVGTREGHYHAGAIHFSRISLNKQMLQGHITIFWQINI